MLPEFFNSERWRLSAFSSNQDHLKAIFGQRAANTLHALIVSDVISNSKVDSFQIIVSGQRN